MATLSEVAKKIESLDTNYLGLANFIEEVIITSNCKKSLTEIISEARELEAGYELVLKVENIVKGINGTKSQIKALKKEVKSLMLYGKYEISLKVVNGSNMTVTYTKYNASDSINGLMTIGKRGKIHKY